MFVAGEYMSCTVVLSLKAIFCQISISEAPPILGYEEYPIC